MLAPEEIYSKKRKPIVGEGEMTHEDRRRERREKKAHKYIPSSLVPGCSRLTYCIEKPLEFARRVSVRCVKSASGRKTARLCLACR